MRLLHIPTATEFVWIHGDAMRFHSMDDRSVVYAFVLNRTRFLAEPHVEKYGPGILTRLDSTSVERLHDGVEMVYAHKFEFVELPDYAEDRLGYTPELSSSPSLVSRVLAYIKRALKVFS